MPNNLVKFVYAASATPEQIAAFDANTIYFVGASGAGEGGKLYKGPRLYDSGSSAAAAELAQLRTYIGTLPVSQEYDDLIDYIDQNVAAAQAAGEAAAQAVEDSLADIATSGAAADASIADTQGNFTATDVEGALQELYTAIGTGGTNAAVTVAKTTGGANDDFVYRYTFSQGGTPITNGVIDIAKDMVATTGELVDEDGEGNPGTFIKMTIANGDDFYVDVADLIEYNSVSSTDEITLTDTNHTISATVGEIAASKIVYREANNSDPENPIAKQTVAQAINALESAVGSGGSIDTRISTAIGALDADVDATAGSVITGITEVDGVITGVDEVALTAANVAYGASNVGAALDTIGAIPTASSATTVVGYVDEKVGAGVGSLNADVDAVLGASDTDPEAVAVVSGVTEANGVITAVDSVAADAAGAATRAKAAIIGQASDTATASTIYGAKAYADSVVGTAVEALDADFDAALGVSDTDTNAVAVMTGVTQADGLITAIDEVAVDRAGAATAAQAAAIAYTDNALTWGSLASS